MNNRSTNDKHAYTRVGEPRAIVELIIAPCGELGTGTYSGVSTVTAMITGAVLSGPFTNSILVIFSVR
jgi:hypothetical protein